MPTLSTLGTIPETSQPTSLRTGSVAKSRPAAALARHGHYLSRSLLHIAPLFFSILIVSVLVFAWIYRHDGPLTAESGPGYWLGIAGAVMMLMLTGYPMRKRFKSLARLGRVASWFRLHMILGILGPTLVILHTNFKLGSLNSRLALLTMLIVVASGIVGRYLYAKVHKGLYGKQMHLREVLADIGDLKLGLMDDVSGNDEIMAELERYIPQEHEAVSLLSGLMTGARIRVSRRRIMSLAKQQLSEHPRTRAWSRRRRRRHLSAIDGQLRTYFAAVKKAQRFAAFERLFGLWHHLHMPLFILLVMSVVLHIVAVHRY